MKFKKNLYIVIISIILYFFLKVCYNKFILENKLDYVYCLDKNVSRGDKVLKTDLIKIKISKEKANKYVKSYVENMYYTNCYDEGSILLNNMILSENEYIKVKSEKEIVSIELDSDEDAASYQIERGSIINIFYSAKLSEIKNVLNSTNKESITSNDLENGYVTIKLFENIKIINCYDREGNIAKKGNIIKTILIEVTKDESINLNNLKNSGKFSVSIIR